ncbi:MAG: SpoIVB peptidase [Oscillospiraceae bacterium]|nr:SpoIVB peptidase [Oscillospiraceae bacterium]
MQKIYKKIRCTLPVLCLCATVLGCSLSAEASGKMLVPGGSVVGIKVECDGVLVVGMNEPEGGDLPAFEAGIRTGDVITHIGADEVESIAEFREELADWSGGEITLRVLRGDKTLQFTVTPTAGQNGGELGVWLRDGMAGLGTVSFYDPDTGLYGALGHAVNDVDTGVLIPVREGEIMQAEVSGVVRGECGKPGELIGSFNRDAELGTIESNCGSGIFGHMKSDCAIAKGKALELAERGEVSVGEATVLAGVDGAVEEYSVEISRIYPEDSGERDLLITVTDPRLIEKTGGIVQGMSGSPIIQDGKLVGAVTHVLVNDPTRGYGIFIENMLEAAG